MTKTRRWYTALGVGVCLLRLPSPAGRPNAWHAEIAQITPNGLWALLAGWLEAYPIRAVAGEAYQIGPLSARVNAPGASRAARDVLGGLKLALPHEVRRIERRAVDVKPWATDKRLDAAGLLVPTKGMPHARDGARHALYCACHDFGARDPLSKRAAVRQARGTDCGHEAYEENGEWRRCADCGHGWAVPA